ncbi:Spt4/RpoE2 zinc finger-domain-containing protein [Annulohypoxylon truncatum]|uniref:Spt4/RpoE2 zinc finger-domain-containing protein n=1 Tax=Annulohypoxylon truncatum TaxID=327061 RepID=UPI0020074E29|nr:Spt4/RpoE2 zinc finger-domain-containing protein [Annulohypoxylon truncatum]KAI1214847.1 Spt4/RpoE2 zinc finger-domain-containing protein [Annulohypoxylon truncatum]
MEGSAPIKQESSPADSEVNISLIPTTEQFPESEQSDSDQQLVESEQSSQPDFDNSNSNTDNMASSESPLANMYIPNNQWRYARACMVCSIIMTQADFRNRGCPNCPFLDMKGSPEAIENCTSSQFNDVHLVVQPQSSWTSKWMRLKDFVPGIYAIKVNGSLPDDVKQTLLEDNHAIVSAQGATQTAGGTKGTGTNGTGLSRQERRRRERDNSRQKQTPATPAASTSTSASASAAAAALLAPASTTSQRRT